METTISNASLSINFCLVPTGGLTDTVLLAFTTWN